MNKYVFFVIICSLILYSCAGTINTTTYLPKAKIPYKNAYIISSENSKYIKFKFGIIYPFGYIPLKDDPSINHIAIGNTDTVICKELEKYGIKSVIGKKNDVPENYDLIVEYNDTWRWDFKNILDKLDIVFITPTGDSIIAKSTYNIYKNKQLHNFPTPEKEVPRMIKEMLNQ